METNWEDERAAFIAGEIGEAVMQLVIDGSEINQGNIVDYLELKRSTKECFETLLRSLGGVSRA